MSGVLRHIAKQV